MYKEKLYTFKDDKIVLKDDLNEYCEVIKKSLIRDINNENKDETKESKFEIDKLEKIESYENFDNLKEILKTANKNLNRYKELN